MATISTKYSVGDVVYFASTTTERKKHPCPDCRGERRWKATSPAGAEYTFPCPRCSSSYNDDHEITLDYTSHVPLVHRLTIGSIQVNTAPGSWDTGASYMAVETGVGSGTVYREEDLYSSEEEAQRVATAKASALDTSIEWVAKLYKKTLSVSDYQLESAKLKNAADGEARARSLVWNINDLFYKIEEATSLEEAREAVQEYITYDWERDKEKAST